MRKLITQIFWEHPAKPLQIFNPSLMTGRGVLFSGQDYHEVQRCANFWQGYSTFSLETRAAPHTCFYGPESSALEYRPIQCSAKLSSPSYSWSKDFHLFNRSLVSLAVWQVLLNLFFHLSAFEVAKWGREIIPNLKRILLAVDHFKQLIGVGQWKITSFHLLYYETI